MLLFYIIIVENIYKYDNIKNYSKYIIYKMFYIQCNILYIKCRKLRVKCIFMLNSYYKFFFIMKINN